MTAKWTKKCKELRIINFIFYNLSVKWSICHVFFYDTYEIKCVQCKNNMQYFLKCQRPFQNKISLLNQDRDFRFS